MVFLIVVGIVALVFAGIYNSLVRKRNQVKNIFATVDAILKKRYDLIPNLVATAQKYTEHEQNVLTEVTRLRAKALSGDTSDDEKIEIDRQISKAIRGIPGFLARRTRTDGGRAPSVERTGCSPDGLDPRATSK